MSVACANCRFTLHGDGSSDRVLLPVVTWVLRQNDRSRLWEGAWADLGRVRLPPRELSERLHKAVELYPCDVLIVHRDAERASFDERLSEIADAARSVQVPVIPLVPVRMTEAWLLFDEAALRKAAGNPSGVMPLDLPSLSVIEGKPDPKQLLFDALRAASGRSGRRLAQLRPEVLRLQLAELIDDFASLRRLPSFTHFEASARATVTAVER